MKSPNTQPGELLVQRRWKQTLTKELIRALKFLNESMLSKIFLLVALYFPIVLPPFLTWDYLHVNIKTYSF